MIGLLEFVVGGLTADSGLEFYLLAWAGTTGGLWFPFEKAEKSLSRESRAAQTIVRLQLADLSDAGTRDGCIHRRSHFFVERESL